VQQQLSAAVAKGVAGAGAPMAITVLRPGIQRHIDWSGIDYTGVDVVSAVVTRNQAQFGASNIRFQQADITGEGQLPSADLLLSKEVLQHLPNDDVAKFLSRHLHKFKYCLITNDLDPTSATSENVNIKRGAYRTLDIRRPPFNVSAELLFTYDVAEDGGWLKGVFCVEGARLTPQ
jgi:hypothetical protein